MFDFRLGREKDVKKELQDQLRDQFPTVFEPSCEFNVGDGWYSLLGITLYEAKSKLATLRLYTSSGRNTPEEIRAQVEEIHSEAYQKSCILCEDCGEPGETQDIWSVLVTLCPTCLHTHRKKLSYLAVASKKRRR
jgi:hypothetical protein